MIYLVALCEKPSCDLPRAGYYRHSDGREYPIQGVRYNVVRRPRQYQGKKETRDDFLDRLRGIVKADPGHFFMRWKVEVTPGDVVKFRRECFDPILEQICLWWSWITATDPAPEEFGGCSPHWRHPFGVYNVLDEGGISDLDEYLASGSTRGLSRATTLFPELEGS